MLRDHRRFSARSVCLHRARQPQRLGFSDHNLGASPTQPQTMTHRRASLTHASQQWESWQSSITGYDTGTYIDEFSIWRRQPWRDSCSCSCSLTCSCPCANSPTCTYACPHRRVGELLDLYHRVCPGPRALTPGGSHDSPTAAIPGNARLTLGFNMDFERLQH